MTPASYSSTNNYNDVMGLFIWPNTDPNTFTNVAILPGTSTTPVAIATVNGRTNSNLLASLTSGAAATEMNGVTRELTTRPYLVTAGVTYRVKMAVADGNDDRLDTVSSCCALC